MLQTLLSSNYRQLLYVIKSWSESVWTSFNCHILLRKHYFNSQSNNVNEVIFLWVYMWLLSTYMPGWVTVTVTALTPKPVHAEWK